MIENVFLKSCLWVQTFSSNDNMLLLVPLLFQNRPRDSILSLHFNRASFIFKSLLSFGTLFLVPEAVFRLKPFLLHSVLPQKCFKHLLAIRNTWMQ